MAEEVTKLEEVKTASDGMVKISIEMYNQLVQKVADQKISISTLNDQLSRLRTQPPVINRTEVVERRPRWPPGTTRRGAPPSWDWARPCSSSARSASSSDAPKPDHPQRYFVKESELMDEQDKKAAAKHAARASTQAKNAAKNTARAAKIAAEGAAEEVNDTLEAAADDVVKTAKRFSPWGAATLTGNAGQGLLAVSVALIAAGFATKKFQGAFQSRHRVLDVTPTSNPLGVKPSTGPM